MKAKGVFLVLAVIRRFDLQGVPDRYAKAVKDIMMKVLTDYYGAHPVYRLSTNDAKHLAIRLVLKRVIVKDRQLVVTLGL